MDDTATKLAAVEQLARRHCNAASNPGAHLLASRILDIIEPGRKVERDEQFYAAESDPADIAANLAADGT